MAIDVDILGALGAGALSFLSPCVLPLVPPYLCYMAGVSVDEFRAAPAAQERAAKRALIGASVAFVLGFSTVFIGLGAGASSIGRLLRAWQEPLAIAAGLLIIVMGLNFLGTGPHPAAVARGALPGRRAAGKRRLRPMSWGLPSPSAGRPASAPCLVRS